MFSFSLQVCVTQQHKNPSVYLRLPGCFSKKLLDQIFRDLDADNGHRGLLSIFSPWHRFSVTLHELNLQHLQQQKEVALFSTEQ